MYDFTKTSMFDILTLLKESITQLQAHERLSFEVLNPDFIGSSYAGNTIIIEDREYLCRSYKSWVDLAQLLHCKMLTPTVASEHTVILHFEKLNSDDSFHKVIKNKEEKYGQESIFSQICKNEESSFIYYYLEALKNVQIDKRVRVLNLGVNSGDEFEALQQSAKEFKNLELVGIDYCTSAIEAAKESFKEHTNISFYQHDINKLQDLNLGEFDLIISIGTLQSSNLEYKPLLMSIVQNQLKKNGAMILGFPNCRWVDGEMIYGAKVKNYAFSEMGLLYSDVMFAKKYLQQKKYRVTITGKDYIFITATSIRKD